tara:strand:- start:1427 stop:1627 length:201 start_codon:yes stop_codon:yes gene_type:complete
VKTNAQLAQELATTSRQVSKSRKRGYITKNDGTKARFTASPALKTSTAKNGVVRNKKGGVKKWGSK